MQVFCITGNVYFLHLYQHKTFILCLFCIGTPEQNNFNWILGVTLVCKTIQVSSVQLTNTSSAHFMVRSFPKATSLSIPIYPLLFTSTCTHLPFPSGYHHRHCCRCLCHIYIAIYLFQCWILEVLSTFI